VEARVRETTGDQDAIGVSFMGDRHSANSESNEDLGTPTKSKCARSKTFTTKAGGKGPEVVLQAIRWGIELHKPLQYLCVTLRCEHVAMISAVRPGYIALDVVVSSAI
jgi:hypothetical protein